MKKTILFLSLLMMMIACGDKPNPNNPAANFTPNKAELGENWETFKHDASFNCWVFEGDRPQERRTPQGARVFWNGDVTPEELNLIDEGLNEMLSACLRDSSESNPPNIWQRYEYFLRPSDYKVMFVQSNYPLQQGETAGCAGMVTGPHGDCGNGQGTCFASGTVCGLNDRVGSSIPGSKGGIYITVPKQSPQQLARTECKTLLKDSVRNEGEHVIFTNDPARYFLHANDGVNGNHQYCRGMVQ